MRSIFHEILARYLGSDQYAFESTSRELWPVEGYVPLTARAPPDTMHPRRNLTVLFIAQAVLGCQAAVYVIVGGLAGALLAESRAFATLPRSCVVKSKRTSARPSALKPASLTSSWLNSFAG